MNEVNRKTLMVAVGAGVLVMLPALADAVKAGVFDIPEAYKTVVGILIMGAIAFTKHVFDRDSE